MASENVLEEEKRSPGKKEKEQGVIYLSRIPYNMQVKKLRGILSEYGELGRVFLQADEKASSGKWNKKFTEGWVEFLDKKKAKIAAATLNNSQVGGKKKAPWYHELWNMKYLPKFRWVHLNERLAYETQVRRQKLRIEIAQAKKETNFYIESVEKKKIMERIQERQKKKQKTESISNQTSESTEERNWEFSQIEPETDDGPPEHKRPKIIEKEIFEKDVKHSRKDRNSKKAKMISEKRSDRAKRKPYKACENKSFLKSLFSSGIASTNDND